MRPIDDKVDVNFMQALRCAGHRLPMRYGMKRTGFAHALGLRYGLLGSVAAHHLLMHCDSSEEHDVLGLVHQWPLIVEEHVRWAVVPRLGFEASAAFPSLIARLAYRPLQGYLSLYRRLCPIDQALRIAHDAFVDEYPAAAAEGWPFWLRNRALKKFARAADDSLRYARGFFERREMGIDEVPEIALLDE